LSDLLGGQLTCETNAISLGAVDYLDDCRYQKEKQTQELTHDPVLSDIRSLLPIKNDFSIPKDHNQHERIEIVDHRNARLLNKISNLSDEIIHM
jgi:hypothetical protein